MAYQKRKPSDSFESLSFRVEAMNTIEPDFTLDNGLSSANLAALISDLQTNLNKYNQTLSDADDYRQTLIELERQAQDASERLLAAALARYGRDSVEYQRIGGKLKRDIIPTGSRPSTYFPDSNGSSNDT